MDKRIILHIIFAAVIAGVYYLFFDDATLTQAITFAIVYVLLSLILDLIIDKRKAKHSKEQGVKVDPKEVFAFIEAVGGKENVESTDSESSRLKVVVKDVDLIDQEQLEALSLEGAYLSGKQLQVTVGVHSSEFSRQIADAISINQ